MHLYLSSLSSYCKQYKVPELISYSIALQADEEESEQMTKLKSP